MVLKTDKTNVMLITSRQKRTNLHNPNLTLRYNETDINLFHSPVTDQYIFKDYLIG